MSKSNSFENQFLKLLFNNTSIQNIGDALGIISSALAGDFYIRLHSSSEVVDDSSIGIEASYVGYVPFGIPVPRSVAGWEVVDNNVSNAATVTFGECIDDSETIRYFSIWKDNVSASEEDRLFWGQLTTDLIVLIGATPKFSVGSININEN